MISEARLEKAMLFLAETDERSAALQADVERAEYKAKAVRDAVFLLSVGTVAERSATAGASTEYLDAMNIYFSNVFAFRAVHNKRQTEALVVGVFRTLEASRRKS